MRTSKPAVEDRRDVMVTLVAEVATNYIALRGLQQQIVIAQENLQAQQHTAVVTRQKLGAGFVSKLDVANADAQVYSTLSDILRYTGDRRLSRTIYAFEFAIGSNSTLRSMSRRPRC